MHICIELTSVLEKSVEQLKKRKKYVLFHRPLPLCLSYTIIVRKVSTSKSSTSDIVLRNVDTRKCNLKVCDKRLQVPITSGDFEAKFFCGDIQQTLYLKEVCELILMN